MIDLRTYDTLVLNSKKLSQKAIIDVLRSRHHCFDPKHFHLSVRFRTSVSARETTMFHSAASKTTRSCYLTTQTLAFLRLGLCLRIFSTPRRPGNNFFPRNSYYRGD